MYSSIDVICPNENNGNYKNWLYGCNVKDLIEEKIIKLEE